MHAQYARVWTLSFICIASLSCTAPGGLSLQPVPTGILPTLASLGPESARDAQAEQYLERKGYDALEAGTHNWAVQGPLGRFSPQQQAGVSAWENASYAIYELIPLDYSGPSLIRLRWDSAPPEYGELWFGLANWETGRWDWRHGSTINQYFFFDQASGYTHNVSGRMLIALVLCGADEAVLTKVQLGYDQPDDWAMVGRDQRRQSRSEFIGPAIPQLKWSYDCGSPAFSSPVIGRDGTVYFGSNGSGLQAVRADGQLSWSFDSGATGVGSPAVAADGTVYMGAADGKLYALGPEGKVVWSYPTASNIVCSPAIDSQGAIYCGSNDGTVFVLNPDGSLKWSAQMSDSSNEGAAVDLNGNVYIPCWDNYLYAFSATGTPAWGTNAGNLMYQHPVVGDRGEVYVACWSNKLLALGMSDGLEAWSFDLGEWNCGAPALAADGTIYAPSSVRGIGDKSLFALDPDGAEKWKFSAEGMFSTPVVDGNGDIYFTVDDGRVVSLDPAGQLRWDFPFEGLSYGTPALGADGTLYVVASSGTLLAIGPGAATF